MANRLARSASPYLRQHADNPVDWFEWGPEVFEKAREEDKPILLSVGYASCHWCHVMAHESFEDPATARMMNDLFVNVKVDREERPDVDAIYMEAVQAMTGHGGWPMTVWLTPEGRPFYAGTYFPKVDRHGMPAFQRVMTAVAEAWQERRGDVTEQASRLSSAIGRKIPPAETLPGWEHLEAAYRTLERSYDRVHGGFGGPPKFPQEPLLELALRIHRAEWAPAAGSMLRHTLTRMASGGIYDQVGGGFARYAVDDEWLVPHFEKMLYDNVQLARIYLWASVELGVDDFGRVAAETFDYLRRDLRHPEGAFFSAEDADSEGVEGRFYTWDPSELIDVLGEDHSRIAASFYGVTEEGNFEGSNVLSRARSVAETAEQLGVDPAEVEDALDPIRAKLASAREQRVRPGLDHKVVVAWNGLAVRAIAEAGAVWERADLLEDGRRCARFLLENLRDEQGRLHRSWSEGELGPLGYLDDYAAFGLGLLSLYQATGEVEWYAEADRLIRAIPELFEDAEHGGYYSTGHDAEPLITRPKDQMDNPAPSGNSLAAEATLLLSLLSGDGELRRRSEDTIRAGGLLIERYPSAAGHLLSVLSSMLKGTKEVAVTGPQARMLARPVWERFRPEVVLAVDVDGSGEGVVPLLSGRVGSTETLAYVCEDLVCAAPVTTREELRRLLDAPTAST